MTYQAAYAKSWIDGGPEAALGFMRAIFHDPDNQRIQGKPTDYLSDDPDRRRKPPADGFDQMARLFVPKQPLDERVDFILEVLAERSPAEDLAHRSQPFNALVFTVSTYDHGTASMLSMHVAPDGRCKRQYGLYHEVIHGNDNYDSDTDDDEDSYAFIYALENSDHYSIKYEGETIDGKTLFRHVRLAQYGMLGTKLIEKLLEREQFAEFPKQLPLRFFVMQPEHREGDEPLDAFEFRRPFDEAAAEKHPLRERYLEASKPPPELTPEDKWLYLLTYLDDASKPEFAQLAVLLAESDALLAATLTLAEESLDQLAGREQPPAEADGPMATAMQAVIDGPLSWNDKLRDPAFVDALGVLEIAMERVSELPDAGADIHAQFRTDILGRLASYDARVRAGDSAALIKARRGPAARATPRAYARLLWVVAPAVDAARSYTKRLLETRTPELPRGEIEDAISAARVAVANVFPVFAMVPESERAALRPVFDTQRALHVGSAHPVMRVLAMESNAELEGAPLLEEGSWEVEYAVEEVPSEYLQAVIDSIEEMPRTFQWYGDKFDFVMNRLKALGKRAAVAGPRVVRLMNDYCTELSDGGQALTNFASILHALEVEEPPKLIRDYVERNQYHNIDFYKDWVSGVPRRRWEQAQADRAAWTDPATWETLLHDSKAGIDLFAEGIAAHTDHAAMIDQLCAAARRPGPLLERLVYRLAELADKKTLEPAAAARIVQLLEALPALDAEHATMLRRTRLVRTRWLVDAGAPDAADEIARLLGLYPDQPALLFSRAQLEFNVRGAARAAELALAAVRTLADGDLVYRKAVFEFTGNDARTWEATTPAQAYALFRWAVDTFQKEHYRSGVFSAASKVLDEDPFYQALEETAAPWSDAERARAVTAAADELAFGDLLLTLGLDELKTHARADNWNVTWQIAQRLATDAQRYTTELLQIWDWYRENEARRERIASLLWPIESIHDTLLRHPSFQSDLAWLITDYPGIAAGTLARQIFTELDHLGLDDVLLATAERLPEHVALGVFLSISPAIQRLKAYDRGIAILRSLIDDKPKGRTRRKHVDGPDLVLIRNNIAALHMQKGDAAAAEAIFDELFAADWSQYDYKPKREDDITTSLFGGDLNAEIAGTFRIYFASAKFNAACLYAQTGRPDQAVAALEDARHHHAAPYNAAKLANEHDFDPIRDHAGFVELVASLGGSR